MFTEKKLLEEKNIHFVFEVSLTLKAIFASLEIVAGILVYMVSPQFFLNFIITITADELTKNPQDLIVNYLLHFAQSLSVGSQHFIAFYLLSHGVIKLLLVVGLMRNKLWCYPLSIAVFIGFIFYQLYRFTFTHSLWLMVLTVFDVVVIWLIWHEYGELKRRKQSAR